MLLAHTRNMIFSRPLCALLAASALFACKTDEVKDDLGNVAIGNGSFHVEQEGDWAPGTSTNYAIKANPGTPKPDSVSCFYGPGSSGDEPVVAVYDSGDDDFDCTYFTPVDAPADSRLNIQVTFGGAVTGGWTNVAK
jgi:hypothetical protein